MRERPSRESFQVTEKRKVLESDSALFDVLMCILLCLLSFYSRFCLLDHPNEVVFDESHFGSFVNHYVRGHYFFDIHPPVGKLLLYASGLLFGYHDGIDYTHISTPYPDYSYMYLRWAPAFFGSLLVPLMYITLRWMRMSQSVACLGMYILCKSFVEQAFMY